MRPDEAVLVDDTGAWGAAARELGVRGVRFETAAQALADVDTLLTGS